jgi:hypothetical protein
VSRTLERLPVLVFRLALVATARVAVASLLVLVGVTWHDASLWVLWVGVPVGVIVLVLWVIDLLRVR